MSNEMIGALLMAAPILWLCSLILTAMRNKDSVIDVDIFVAAIAAACWVAGRIIAGKGMMELLAA